MDIPNSLLAPARGLEALGNSMTGLASTMIQIDAHRQQQESAAMRLAHVSMFNLKASQSIDGLFTQAEADAPENIDSWRQPISDAFQSQWDYINNDVEDPILKGLLTRQHSELQLSYGKKFNDLAIKRNREFAQSSFFESFDYGLKSYLNAADPDGESKAATDMAMAIQRAEATNIITPELANRAKRDMEGAINKKAVARLESVINGAESMSPAEMNQFVKDLTDPEKHTALSVADRRVLWNKAVTTFKSVIKEQVTSRAYDLLFRETGGNFPVMAETLNDPENRKTLGLDMEQTDYLRGFIARAQKDDYDRKTALFDKTAKEMFLNFNKLTPKAVDDAVRNGQLDYKTGEHFKTELKQTADAKTDPGAYSRFQEMIYEGADPAATRKRIIQSGGLSRSDKEQLLNKTEAQIEKLDAKNLSRAMAYLKETVMPSQTMITAAKPDEALNFLKASEAMEVEVLNARKAGKPLTSQQVIEKAQEISQAFKMTTREQIEAAQKRIRDEAQKMRKPEKGTKKLKYNPATGKLE